MSHRNESKQRQGSPNPEHAATLVKNARPPL